jgi:hypothetical protein
MSDGHQINKQLNRSECWKEQEETTREKAGVGMLDNNPVRLNPHFIQRVTTKIHHDISVFSNLLFDGSPCV